MRIVKHFYKNYEWGLIPEVNIYCKASVMYHLWFFGCMQQKATSFNLKREFSGRIWKFLFTESGGMLMNQILKACGLQSISRGLGNRNDEVGKNCYQ